MRLSAHFVSEEFGCPGAHQRWHQAHPTVVDGHLIEHLEELRLLVGRPLIVVSGHRCLAWERYRGRSGLSQHVHGRAADLVSGYATVAQAEQAGFTGIGNAGLWAAHVDVGPGGRRRWSY